LFSSYHLDNRGFLVLKFVVTVSGAVAIAAALTACTGGTATPPALQAAASSTTTSSVSMSPTTARGATHAVHTSHVRSWIDPAAKSGPLVYVTDSGTNTAQVYSYPALKNVGTIGGLDNPQGDCVDGNNNVWIVNTQASQILEYAHGGTTPIATLSDPNQYPVGCSFDPTSGNLAVSNFYSTSGPPGSVSIYTNATGTPATFTPPGFAVVYYLGYDAKGTLYLDGIDSGSSFLFSSFNGKKFTSITLEHPIGGPGTVQAVGDRVVVGDQTNGANAAYGFKIHASKGTLVKTTPLTGANDVVQFNIYKNSLVGADINFSSGSTVDRFKYPAGGSPVKSTPGLSAPIGAVVSP
jgi:hypothetical protein